MGQFKSKGQTALDGDCLWQRLSNWDHALVYCEGMIPPGIVDRSLITALGEACEGKDEFAVRAAVDGFNEDLVRRLQQLPGVKAAGVTSFLPASGNISNSTFMVDGYVPPEGAGMNLATMVTVHGDYLQAMGFRCWPDDSSCSADTANTQLVAIVNHKLAEHYWPGADPIGKRLRIGTKDMQAPWLTVVGEIADVKESSPDAPSKEEWYQPVEQFEKSMGALGSPKDINGNGGFIALGTDSSTRYWFQELPSLSAKK
jgi:hypothetical protein